VSAISDLTEERVRRRRNLDAEREGREREVTTAEGWARDPLGWIKANVWIASKFQDGDVKRVRPVRMTEIWPDQERTIRAWINVPLVEQTGELEFNNVLVEKSRQIGETWAIAAAVDWLLSYHEVRGLFMHTRGAEVADRGWTVDSFMGRIKFIHDRCVAANVPGAMDLVFRPFSTDPASVSNFYTGAVLRGEGQRDDPGRGSTFDFAIIDEAAHILHGEQVHAALDSACPTGKLYLSTPEGDTNMHARMCDEKPSGWEYLRLHWSDHPIYGRGLHVAGKADDCEACAHTRDGTAWTANNPLSHRYPGRLTSPWYDGAVIGKTDEQVASELDIDRERSLSGRIYPEFNSGTHVIHTGIGYDPNLEIQFGWDFGLDCTSVPIIQDGPEDIRVIGLVEMGDLFANVATPEQVSTRVRSYLRELGVPDELLTSDETLKMRAVGDPAGQARSLDSARPYVDQYRNQGFRIERPPTRLTAKVDFSIISVQRILTGAPKPLRVCGVNAREFARHIGSNRWKTDAHGTPTQPRAILDDVHNHCARAFAYWAVATYPPPSGGGARSRVPKGRIPTPGGVARAIGNRP
jgi:hypothetical protein